MEKRAGTLTGRLCRLLIMITVIAESLTFHWHASRSSGTGLIIPLKENLPQLFHSLLFAGPSQCPRRNICSDDVPFEFCENDALNKVVQLSAVVYFVNWVIRNAIQSWPVTCFLSVSYHPSHSRTRSHAQAKRNGLSR